MTVRNDESTQRLKALRCEPERESGSGFQKQSELLRSAVLPFCLCFCVLRCLPHCQPKAERCSRSLSFIRHTAYGRYSTPLTPRCARSQPVQRSMNPATSSPTSSSPSPLSSFQPTFSQSTSPSLTSSSPFSSPSIPTVGGLQAVLSDDPYQYGQFPLAGRQSHSLQTPFTEHCLFKSATNGVMGAALGLVWGVFMTSMGTGVNSWATVPGGPGWVDPSTLSTKEALKLTARDMYRASKSSARSFGVIGAIYTAVECSIEKERGKHDLTNALAAGCITGGMLAVKGGPQATAIGCAGFAAFGYVMDRFLLS